MSEWRSSPDSGQAIFKQRSATTPFTQSNHQRSPFASSGNRLGIDECCSAFTTKLSFTDSASPGHKSAFSSHSPPRGSVSTMTIGHFGHSRHSSSGHHHSNHSNHYGYHNDAFHDDGQMLPRIDFPAGQFDRLLRGPSPNNNNNNNSHSRHYSHHYSSNGNSPGNDRSSGNGGSWKSGPFDSRKK